MHARAFTLRKRWRKTRDISWRDFTPLGVEDVVGPMRLPAPMRLLLCCCLLLLSVAVIRADERPRGRLVSKVVSEADPPHSYVLYVPGGYTPERRWPVIFCFDPSARGQIPVERLQNAAEKYGYILAGSLTSRNGPLSANAVAAQAMIKDVNARYSLDPRRVYATGMSGGARVATTIALSGVAKGVIACGAGFPTLPDGIPLKVPFVFFGIVGREDFNFGELRRLDDDLNERGAVHHIATFEGGHVWSPEASMTEAVEWLELQAMRAGTTAKDDAFIAERFAERRARIAQLSGLEKWRATKSLAADFDGLVDARDFARDADALGKTKEIKNALKKESRLFAKESELIEELGEAALGSLSSKQRLAGKLREQIDAVGDPAERSMIKRAIAGYCSIAQETARDSTAQRDYRRAVDLLELFVALRPEHARGWSDLARAYAHVGETTLALDALERAASNGFSDESRVEGEPAFARLRSDARFVEVCAKIKANRTDPVTELPAMRISSVLANVELRLFYQSKSGRDFDALAFLKVVSVRAGSAAAEAGVAPDMEITSIQGCRVFGLTEGELNHAMAQPAKGEIVFTVRDSPRGVEKTIRVPIARRSQGPASVETTRAEES
jgi:predicted esterase